MKIDIEQVQTIEGNLSLHKHKQALIELTNAYLNDQMGEERTFVSNLETDLISGLALHPAAFIFFAEYNNKIIGLSTCFLGFSTFCAKKLLNIHDLIVLPEYRRNGVAEKILLFIEKKAKNMNCCKLTLEVRTDNINAIGLYKKINFGDGEHPMYFWIKEI